MDNPRLFDSLELGLKLMRHFKLPRLDDPESETVDLDKVAYYHDAFKVATYNLKSLYAKRRRIVMRENRGKRGRRPQ